jgi:hypothetical protein
VSVDEHAPVCAVYVDEGATATFSAVAYMVNSLQDDTCFPASGAEQDDAIHAAHLPKRFACLRRGWLRVYMYTSACGLSGTVPKIVTSRSDHS